MLAISMGKPIAHVQIYDGKSKCLFRLVVGNFAIGRVCSYSSYAVVVNERRPRCDYPAFAPNEERLEIAEGNTRADGRIEL